MKCKGVGMFVSPVSVISASFKKKKIYIFRIVMLFAIIQSQAASLD